MVDKLPTNTKDFVYDGVRSIAYYCQIGAGIPKHQHAYDHATVCVQGSIVVRKEGKQKTLTASDPAINLVAGEWHEIEALEDDTIFINISRASTTDSLNYVAQA